MGATENYFRINSNTETSLMKFDVRLWSEVALCVP